MIVGISIYDNKEIDTESEDFKNQIAEAVKELVLRDWDKITYIEQREEMKDGEKAYRTIVELWRDGDET